MVKLHGDWYHSRTGSQLSELAAIQLLVSSSKKTEFFGKSWGADRRNPLNAWIYDFSATAKLDNSSIEPSTMQTKLRNWIRLGFLKDKKKLPLEWTQLGMLWVDAVDDGRGRDANLLYRLVIANALSLVSFSPEHKTSDIIPQENGLVLKFLIRKIHEGMGVITKKKLEDLIDGDTVRKKSKNYSYWVTDLAQSGLFKKNDEGGLTFGKDFKVMLDAISSYIPAPKITVQDIKDNPLAMGAPFREALIAEFKEYGSIELIEAVETLSKLRIELSDLQLRRKLSEKQGQRTTVWSKSVKSNYYYKCAVPYCDAEGTLFLQAAHIMPFSVEDSVTNNYHRNDIENGVAMCLSCHKMFDAGLFTFNSYGSIIASKFIYSSELIQTEDQVNVRRILNSENKKVFIPISIKFNSNYAKYHRENIFLGE